jgi:hypothetical protein
MVQNFTFNTTVGGGNECPETQHGDRALNTTGTGSPPDPTIGFPLRLGIHHPFFACCSKKRKKKKVHSRPYPAELPRDQLQGI